MFRRARLGAGSIGASVELAGSLGSELIDIALRGRPFRQLAVPGESERSACGCEAVGKVARCEIPISSRNAKFDAKPATAGRAEVDTRRGLSLGVVLPAISEASTWGETPHVDCGVCCSGVVAIAIVDLEGPGTSNVKHETGKDRPFPFPMVEEASSKTVVGSAAAA